MKEFLKKKLDQMHPEFWLFFPMLLYGLYLLRQIVELLK